MARPARRGRGRGVAASPRSLDYGERRMRAALARPARRHAGRFADVLDSTGAGRGQREPATIAVTVTVAGDAVTFDFDRHRPAGRRQRQRGRGGHRVCGRASPSGPTTEPTSPPTAAPCARCACSPPPARSSPPSSPPPSAPGNVEVSQRVADVCFGALAQVAPERVGGADQGTMNNLLVGGDGWVYYETVAGGQGARPSRAGQPPRPGQSGIQTGMTNTKNTPVEALERAFPMRVLRYRLRSGSGGVGAGARRRRHRAGPAGARGLHGVA